MDDSLSLVPADETQAKQYLDLYLRNAEHLRPWQPSREKAFYSWAHQQEMLRHLETARVSGTDFVFGIFLRDVLIGRIALTGIERGPFQNAHLGYFVDKAYQNKGIATQAVGKILEYGFCQIKLHRIDAAVMPNNVRSIKVLEKHGFRLIGVSPRHLMIAGRWEDHLLYAITAEAFTVRAR